MLYLPAGAPSLSKSIIDKMGRGGKSQKNVELEGNLKESRDNMWSGSRASIGRKQDRNLQTRSRRGNLGRVPEAN